MGVVGLSSALLGLEPRDTQISRRAHSPPGAGPAAEQGKCSVKLPIKEVSQSGVREKLQMDSRPCFSQAVLERVAEFIETFPPG